MVRVSENHPGRFENPAMAADEQTETELLTLSAIFPEIRRLDGDSPYTLVLDILVKPAKALTVLFPAAIEPQAPTPANRAPFSEQPDSYQLSHLPAIRLQVTLPPDYPSKKPPTASVSATPSWLPPPTVKQLEGDCMRLWEDMGREPVIYTYVVHIQQSADDVFGLLNDQGALEISPAHRIGLLEYDIGAKRIAFEKGTFHCGVCLNPKKGSKCHSMIDCGHVFCVGCLQDFYTNAIKEGDVAAVRCLEPSCAKERSAPQACDNKKRSKAKTFICPSELVQIHVEPDMVHRYVTLMYKTELESDKSTVYCPRAWCQGAARSKKHKKPKGFKLYEIQDDSECESEKQAGTDDKLTKAKSVGVDRLAVCEDCGFAFCRRCFKGWHGDYVTCALRCDKEEVNEEEMASLEFISLHTTACPTCACPVQKTHGCNHMICFRCQTHFCYLCSGWLDASNPFQHFNVQPNGRTTGCYMRLWELEEGDEHGQIAFAGGRVAQEAQAARHEQELAAIALEEAIRPTSNGSQWSRAGATST